MYQDMSETEKGEVMNVTAKDKSTCKTILDALGLFGALVGIFGGILGILGYCHALKIEDRQERRSCIADLSSFPSSIRPTAEDMTDSVLKWTVTPDIGHRSAAKKTSINLQIQLQTMSGQMEKYNFTDASLDDLTKRVNDIIVSIKNNDAENAAIDSYANALDKLIAAPVFSKRCPN